MNQSADSRRPMAGVLRLWWWLVLMLAAVGSIAGYVVSKQIEPAYRATTTLLVGNLTTAPNFSKDDVEASRLLASTYGTLIRSQSVLGNVIQELGLRTSWQELRNHVRVDLGTTDTHLITVDVFARSPAQARAIAATVAKQVVAMSAVGIRRPDTDAAIFSSKQVSELEEIITQEEERVARLETALASARTPQATERLRSNVVEQENLVLDLQRNYASMLRFLRADVVPNSVDVLPSAEPIAARIRPNMLVNTAMGAIIGALIGVGITHPLALRRVRRWRHASGRATRDWARPAAEGDYTNAKRRPPIEKWSPEMAAFDPWVRELADPPAGSRTSRGGRPR